MYRTVVKTAISHSPGVSKFKLGQLLTGTFNTTLNPSLYIKVITPYTSKHGHKNKIKLCT